MLSQNVAKTTVPSYNMIRTNLPHRKPQNQWEGVYYYSGTTRRQQHLILLQRKRERAAQLRSFNVSRAAVLSAYGDLSSDSGDLYPRYQLACQLAQHGLPHEAADCLDPLHHGRQLDPLMYTQYIHDLAAARVADRVLHCEAMGDPALMYKFLGENAGEERAADAYRWIDRATHALRERHGRSRATFSEGRMAASQLTNALMRALMTCGYAHVAAVPTAVYDRMGAQGIAPTISTYEQVMLALALQGAVAEAEDIASFLRQHHPGSITIRTYNALLLGHREAKAYDRCDALWQELVDRRWPRANATTAELYLRSIIDHSYTPTSAPLQHFGDVHVVAKKKIPVVLAQLDELGIARTHLSRPLMDEVEDALRKFLMHRSRFYEWGRAVKQFDFIEFRRRNGWLYDLHLMKNTTKSTPPVRDPTQPGATQAAVATAELPAFFSERQPWERQPLEETLFTTHERERTDDVRAGDIYYDEIKSVQERSPSWMTEVPETRYDQLYGVNRPDIAKIGIRRLLDVEYTNRQAVVERDAAVIQKSMSRGRRLRQKMEGARTHRNEADVKNAD